VGSGDLFVGGSRREVDDGMRTEIVQVVGDVRGAGGKNARSGPVRELDGRLADTTAGAIDQEAGRINRRRLPRRSP
jgi:hypothetical protein